MPLLTVKMSNKESLPGSKNETVEIALVEWFLQARASSVPLSGPVMKEKVLDLAFTFGVIEFSASKG